MTVLFVLLESGSLVSARHALDQNRDVFAVPGPARSENSAGVHALIRDGAALVTKAEDVLDELRPDIRELLSSRTKSTVTETETLPVDVDEIDEVEREILRELKMANRAIDVDSILERLEIPTDRALAALCRLEVKGLIWSLAGGLYQARP